MKIARRAGGDLTVLLDLLAKNVEGHIFVGMSVQNCISNTSQQLEKAEVA